MDYKEMMQFAPKDCQPTVVDTRKDYQESLEEVARAKRKKVEELSPKEREEAMGRIGLCDLDFM